jgi:hypothetical protein
MLEMLIIEHLNFSRTFVISFGIGWLKKIKMDWRHFMDTSMEFRSFNLVKRQPRYGLAKLKVSLENKIPQPIILYLGLQPKFALSTHMKNLTHIVQHSCFQ